VSLLLHVSSTDFAKQARAHFERGAFQEAATACRRGLLANPGDVEARVLLGRALMALQRYGEVLAEMRVLLDREPGNPLGLALKGEALLYRGDVPRAVQALRDAHAVSPHDPAIRALRERAEHAAAADARGFVFVDEDPSSNVTRHYASPPDSGSTQRGAGALGGDAAELFDNLLGEERQATAPAAPAAPRGAGPRGRPAPPSPPRQPPPAAPGPRGAAPGPRGAAPGPRGAAPAPRGAAPAPASPPRDASSSDLLPEHSGSFDEPTAIYGDGHFASKAMSPPAPPRPASPPPGMDRGRAMDRGRGPAPGAPDRGPPSRGLAAGQPGKPAPAPAPRIAQPIGPPIDLPPVSLDALDAAEFDDEMAPTSTIDVDRSLRVRPETGTAPNLLRYSTQETTDEAQPPALPSMSFPSTSTAPTLAPRGAPPPPAGSSGSPMARAPAGAPGRVVAPAAPTSPEMPVARAVAEARRSMAPQPAPPPRPPPTERPVMAQPPMSRPLPTERAPERAMIAPQPAPWPSPAERPPERQAERAMMAPQPPAPAHRLAASERPLPVLQPVPASGDPYDPTIAVPRHSRQSRAWQYLLVALIVIAGGAVGGLQLRKLRLDWEIDGARRRADELMASDTYAGYLRAIDLYRDVLAVRSLPGDLASLARAQAALAAEFDEGYGDAQAAVQALGADDATGGPDAPLARAYLALAQRDAAGALAQLDLLAAQVSEHPFASYLTGRARLLTGDAQAALAAFQQAAERTPRPMFLVWLGHAHRALGREKDAADAFARALAQVPGHPAALLGRAELAASGQDAAVPGAAKGELEPALEALIADGARPLGQQTIGVSSGQMARAALALVALRARGGDQAGARRALQQLQAMRREGDPDFAVILAQAQAQLGDTDAALAELAAVAEAWPTRLDARMAWAELALRAGNLDAARKALIGVQGMDSAIAGNARALTLRGRTRLALGSVDTALADLDAALALHPDLLDAVVARAEVDLARGDATSAAARLGPRAGEGASAEVRLVHAAALRGSGQYDQARTVLEALIKAPAAPPRTYLELARLERDQGRWTEARAAYASAIERLKTADGGAQARPSAPIDARPEARSAATIEARIEAARLALDTGNRTGAREAIAAVASAAASKNDGRVLVEAARIHTLDGAHRQANAYLERAEALSSPPAAQLARERGRLALRQGDIQEAIRALDKARALPGGDAEAMLLLVEAHLAQRDLPAATAARDDYAQRAGMDPASLALAEGLIAAATGQATGTQAARDQVTAALAAYDRARELLTKRNAPPRHIAYLDYLTGRALFEYDRLREASKALERAIRIDPGHADPYFVLGLVEYGDNDYSDAAESFEDALKRDAASLPEAWFYLGEVEVERKHEDEAQKAFRAYLELRPEGARAEDARRYLDQLGR
jgi:tetratricopeptide (TPR) repeat protein